jgi:hypothetical protein
MKLTIQLFLFFTLVSHALFIGGSAADKENAKSFQKTTNCQKLSAIDKYHLETADQIKKKWHAPKDSVCDTNYQIDIVLTVLANGEIKDIYFCKKSNCKDLDESAYLAVMKAAPFKPFPVEIKVEQVRLGIGFSPN